MSDINLLVANPGSANIDDCLAQLTSALAELKTVGFSDTDVSNFLNVALQVPAADAGKAFAKIFEVKASDLPPDDQAFQKPIIAASVSLGASISNPYAALTNQGLNLNSGASTSLDATLFLSIGGGQIAAQIFDQTRTMLQSFFLLGNSSESNLTALFLHAIEECLPLIAGEQSHLASMKAVVKNLMEECSRMPPAFIPEIPNLVVIQKLCEAEADLNNVLSELKQFNTFDRPTFAHATKSVCTAQSVVKSGQLTSDSIALLKRAFGLTDLQANMMIQMHFVPSPQFWLQLNRLAKLNQFVQQYDPTISALDNNIKNFHNSLNKINGMGLQVVIQSIIEALTTRIVQVRSALEINAQQNIEDLPGRLTATGNISQPDSDLSLDIIAAQKRRIAQKIKTYATSVDYSAVYTELASLCHVMRKANAMYDNINGVLRRQSAMMNRINDIVKNHIGVNCGSTAASNVDTAVAAFVSAVETRLSGVKGTNEIVMTTGMTLLDQIDAQRKYLHCVGRSLQNARKSSSSALDKVLGAAAAATSQIADLLRLLPAMQQALRTLDLNRLVGTANAEYDGLDKLMSGLNCLAQACTNDYVSSTTRDANAQFADELALRKSKAFTMGQLDETPLIAVKVAADFRFKRVTKALVQLQQFVQLDFKKFCTQVALNNMTSPAAALPQVDSVTPPKTPVQPGTPALPFADQNIGLA